MATSTFLGGVPRVRDDEILLRAGFGKKVPKVVAQVIRGREPLRGPLRQGLQANALRFLRDCVIPLPERTNFLVRDLLEKLLP